MAAQVYASDQRGLVKPRMQIRLYDCSMTSATQKWVIHDNQSTPVKITSSENKGIYSPDFIYFCELISTDTCDIWAKCIYVIMELILMAY